jgi:hypothetical protein
LTAEQVTEKVIEHTGEISALWESAKSAHKRIDENDRITEGIHKLTTNVETLALQVKHLAEKVEQTVNRLELGLKSQGERIGALEKEPGRKWKVLWERIGLAVAGALATAAVALALDAVRG